MTAGLDLDKLRPGDSIDLAIFLAMDIDPVLRFGSIKMSDGTEVPRIYLIHETKRNHVIRLKYSNHRLSARYLFGYETYR